MAQFSYEVLKVRHENGDHSRIIRYLVKNLTGGWIPPSISEMDRMDMVSFLGAETKIGVRENPSDNELIPVFFESINGRLYIKTVANNIPEDNLGNLSEF